MQMGLFTGPEYQKHRDFMFLLNTAKVLVNGVVLPKILQIFGTTERTPQLHQQGQQSRAQRVHTLALVKLFVEPKLKELGEWHRHYSEEP
jgi:hypothetical protein